MADAPTDHDNTIDDSPDRTRKWTCDDRARALEAYYRTGNRGKVRRETGVPERTISSWLTDPQYAEEREAVQSGLRRAMEAEAGRRGAELAEAINEAILVCRKALREMPDGRAASSLLTALGRARETEDRIRRLDEGRATDIHGVQLSEAEREAFRDWLDEHRRRETVSDEDLLRQLEEDTWSFIAERLEQANTEDTRRLLDLALLSGDGALVRALETDAGLAQRLADITERALAGAAAGKEAGDHPVMTVMT